MSFGEMLRSHRNAANLTQAELGRAAKLAVRTISDLERGVTPTAQPDTARRLAGALGLTGDERVRFLAAARGGDAEGTPMPRGVPEAALKFPQVPASFTGRELELRQLLDAVNGAADFGGGTRICVIHGMAGVGKTAFASRAAGIIADRFPAGQFFMRLYGHVPGVLPADPGDALSALLLAIGTPPSAIPAEPGRRAEFWREKMADRRALLLLDDARDSEQVRPLLPGGEAALVLVTSRQQLSILPDAANIFLEILRPAHAASLFVRLVRRPGLRADDARVADVVRLCGYLPLAITMIAGQLKQHRARELADLVTALRGGSRLSRMASEGLSVAGAFDLSYRDLAAGLQQMFRHLALHPGPAAEVYAAAALAGCDLALAQKLLTDLAGYHLVEEAVPGRYRFHDLIGEHARTLAARDPVAVRKKAELRMLSYYLHMARTADRFLLRRTPTGLPRVEGAAPRFTPPLPDRQAALEWMDTNYPSLHAAAEYAQIHGYDGYAIAIPAAMDAYLLRRGRWREALDLHHLAMRVASGIDDRPSVARSRSDIGRIQLMMGDMPAAGASLAEALALHRDLGDKLGEAQTLKQLSSLEYAAGKYQSAGDRLLLARALYQEAGDARGEAEVISTYGVVQQERGQYTAALESQRTALDMYTALDDPIGRANALCHLGSMNTDRGRHADAIADLQRAEELYLNGGDLWNVAGARYFLGVAQRLAGDYEAAGDSLGAALETYRAAGDLLDQAGVLGEIGLTQIATGQYARAQASLEKALAIYEGLDARNGVVTVINSTGELALASGSAADAIARHEEALSIAGELGMHREEARALDGLGRAYFRLRRHGPAIESLRRAHEIYEGLESPLADQAKVLMDRLIAIQGPWHRIPTER